LGPGGEGTDFKGKGVLVRLSKRGVWVGRVPTFCGQGGDTGGVLLEVGGGKKTTRRPKPKVYPPKNRSKKNRFCGGGFGSGTCGKEVPGAV